LGRRIAGVPGVRGDFASNSDVKSTRVTT
jgi:hypothetical protein